MRSSCPVINEEASTLKWTDMRSSSRLKVVLLTNGFTPNRVPLWNALGRLCDLTIVLLSPTEKRREWELSLEEIAPDVRIAGAKQFYFYKMEWSLNLAFLSVFKILDELMPQAVIVGGFESPGYWAANSWARKKRVPIVLWMGSTLLSSRTVGNPIVGFIKRQFVTRCDAYYTYSRSASEYLQHFGAPADRIVTGINHTNAEHFLACERIGPFESCALLYVGRLISLKGVVELFKALALLTDLPWTLTIAGDGELRSVLTKDAERYGFADRISWKSYIQQRDLNTVYRRADLLLMPSLKEVWGLVVNEALMSGVYVIGSNRAAASLELIKSGVNGEIVEPEPVALERAIRKAIKRAPFQRRSIRETISHVTAEGEAAKISHAIDLACGLRERCQQSSS
jgi:glycosyltransferase involved in cell wall biosynthesis